MIEDFDLAKRMLVIDEGDEEYVYDCGSGGRVYAEDGSLTIGIGHNLETRPLSRAVRDLLFSEDWAIALDICKNLYPKYSSFTQPRRLAFLDMAFNLGVKRLAAFKRMNEAVNTENWATAAREARESIWFHQVPHRAARLAWMIEKDQIHKDYLE